MKLRECREALNEALNAHDKEAMKAFIDPSYVAKSLDGKVVGDYWKLLDYVAVLFNDHPEFQQSLEVESIEIKGETAKVITRRVEHMKVLWWFNWNSVSRWTEAWELVDGRWVMIEEQPAPA